MKTHLVVAAFAFAAGMAGGPIAQTQDAARSPVSVDSAVQRHVAGLALERRGDEKGAFLAFLDAAEHGYPPAQRKLGEIYDSGNAAVERNYEESIRWYQRAREGGEVLPEQPSYGTLQWPSFNIGR